MGRAASPHGLAKSVNADSIALPTGGVSPDAAAVRSDPCAPVQSPHGVRLNAGHRTERRIIVTDQACDKTHNAGETYPALKLLDEHHNSKELHSRAVIHAQPE